MIQLSTSQVIELVTDLIVKIRHEIILVAKFYKAIK